MNAFSKALSGLSRLCGVIVLLLVCFGCTKRIHTPLTFDVSCAGVRIEPSAPTFNAGLDISYRLIVDEPTKLCVPDPRYGYYDYDGDLAVVRAVPLSSDIDSIRRFDQDIQFVRVKEKRLDEMNSFGSVALQAISVEGDRFPAVPRGKYKLELAYLTGQCRNKMVREYCVTESVPFFVQTTQEYLTER